LHLDFAQALAWNPLFVVMAPFLLFGLARIAFQMWTGRGAPGINWPRWGTRAILWLMLTYWVVRNIPYEPFTLLAPHRLEDPVTQQIDGSGSGKVPRRYVTRLRGAGFIDTQVADSL